MTRIGMGFIALAMLPAVLTAQADSSRMRVDSTRGRHHRTAAGEVSRGSRSLGLTRDEITQLQTALRQADCDPGPSDGILGPRTRQAMSCARQKKSITGNNYNDLFRSLNLTFTTQDSLGGRSGRGMDRLRGDTSMRHPMRDSLRRPRSTRKDTTP